MSNLRSWTKPGKLTPTRPVPSGNSAGTGQQPSLNNPFGGTLPATPGVAPNARPGPPDRLTQMGGQPAADTQGRPLASPTPGVPGKKKGQPVLKPRSGDETSLTRSGGETRAPKVPMEELSPKDRVATVGHLAQTMGVAASHSAAHAQEANKEAAKAKPSLKRIRHNTAHSQKHSEEVVQHGQKLDDHLKKYPGAESAAAELLKVSPSRKAGPPKGAK